MPSPIEKLNALDDSDYEEDYTSSQEACFLKLKSELIALWNECQRAHLYLDLPLDVEHALDVLNCKAEEVLK